MSTETPLSRRINQIAQVENWRDYAVVLFLILLVVVFTATSPVFLTIDNILNILRQAGIVALLGIGLTFVLISAEIDISIGAIMALSAVLASMTLNAGYGVISAIIVGLFTGLVIGAINGFVTVKVGVPSFLVTLGMLGAARGLALIITGTQSVIVNNNNFALVFGSFVVGIPIIVLWTAVAAVISYVILSKTRFGKHVYAAGDNATAARYTGISTSRVKFLTLVISGLAAGLAGLLMVGRFGAARPTMGTGIELAVIAAVIIGGTSLFGGRGWIPGTIIGAILLSVIDNGLVLNGFSSSYQQFIRGVIIILAVAFRSSDGEGGWG
jgi:ribose transport system permease protein